MMRSLKIFTVIVLCFCGAANAIESKQTGKVIDLRVSSKSIVNGNPTHFKISGTWIGQPECAKSGYWSIDSDTVGGKTLLSALLVAYTTGKQVTVRNFNDINCDNRSDMADVKQIDFAD